MAQYELIAKHDLYLGNGNLIHKDDVFTVTLTSPGAGANKNAPFLPSNQPSVLRVFKEVHDIALPPNYLTNASFLAVRVR